MKLQTVKVKIPDQTCPKCAGTGVVPLSDELRVVLNEVKRRRGATAPMIHDALDQRGEFNVTAFNNRLTMLWQMGYITRRKAGRTWFYSAA